MLPATRNYIEDNNLYKMFMSPNLKEPHRILTITLYQFYRLNETYIILKT